MARGPIPFWGIGLAVVEVARQRDYLPRKITTPGTDPALWFRGRPVAPTTTGPAISIAKDIAGRVSRRNTILSNILAAPIIAVWQEYQSP